MQLFNVNVRRMSMLVSEPKYSFLKELGLGEVNDGVYDGKWFGSGEVSRASAITLLNSSRGPRAVYKYSR